MTASRVHSSPLELTGRRVVLRTLTESDYPEWFEVRNRCRIGVFGHARPDPNQAVAFVHGVGAVAEAMLQRAVGWLAGGIEDCAVNIDLPAMVRTADALFGDQAILE